MREKEDAANEFARDANSLSREEAVCATCSQLHADIPYSSLELHCKKPGCAAVTMLPPAVPIVMRPDGPGALRSPKAARTLSGTHAVALRAREPWPAMRWALRGGALHGPTRER